MKNKGIAILLTLFLGGIGAHKFYLGNTVQGVFYLLFCWTLVPMLISVIDLLVYIFTGHKSWDRKYNSRYMM